MAYEFKLPDIGEGVVEGEIVRWLVNDGDMLNADQPMVEIMTDKATVEIPSPRAGKVLARLYKEGQICPVGQVLIRIETENAAPSEPVATAKSPGKPPVAAKAEQVGAPGQVSTVGVLATPATRKLAREMAIDLAAVPGTGNGGRITSDNVRASQGKPPENAAPGMDVRVPFRGIRKKIAENMSRSKHVAAHFTYVEEIDCTALVGLREKANQRLAARGLKLSYLPFIIKATVEALRKLPQLNAYLDEATSEIVQRRQYHIGLASTTPDGLVVPVVRDADQKSVVDLARDIDRLAALTKAGKASREDLTGSTFTITSLGSLGGLLATPIINFPEVAILGVHKIAKKPAVIDDKIVIRDLMNLSISVDHRLVDGHEAARFVADIKESLESPGLLFLDAI